MPRPGARLLPASLAVALPLLALPLLAAAAPPARDFHGTFRDTFSEVVCGVPVTTTVQGAGTFAVFFGPGDRLQPWVA